MKKNIRKTLLPVLLFLLLCPVVCFAQETPPREFGHSINAWLFALLGAGAIYGAMRMNKESER